MSFTKNQKLALLLIFFIALFLRLYHLGSVPFGFHVDELNAGYIGRYIWLHGRDIQGNVLPLMYNKFGDFRPAGIFYLSGLSTFLFGINEFAVRFPAAGIGALTSIAIYFFAAELFGSVGIGVIAAGVLAIFPWHIVLSRATSEGIIGLFVLLVGLAYLARGVRRGEKKQLLVGGLFVLASYFFYHSFRLLGPLVTLPLLWCPKLKKPLWQTGALVVGLTVFGTVLISLTPWGKGRLNQVIFYNNPSAQTTLTILANGDGQSNVATARTFHNKAVVYTREFLKQYLEYYSSSFLFITGGLPFRYVVPDHGLLLIVFAPFLLIGLLAMFRRKDIIPAWYTLWLFLVAPLPAAITYEDAPNVHRALFLIIPLGIVISVGGAFVWSFVCRQRMSVQRIVLMVSFLFITLESVYFFHQYQGHTAAFKSVARNDGTRELIRLAIAKQNLVDTIILPTYDELPMYYWFYAHRFASLTREELPTDQKVSRYGKFVFVNTWCPLDHLAEYGDMEKKLLVVNSGECPVKDSTFRFSKNIWRSDMTKAFRIVTNTAGILPQ